MFVDVLAEVQDGSTFLARTLVLKDKAGDWRVLPRPDLYEVLSSGLTAEPDSTVLWGAEK